MKFTVFVGEKARLSSSRGNRDTNATSELWSFIDVTYTVFAMSDFANPEAPPDQVYTGAQEAKPLSNADFRKLLMTPKVDAGPSRFAHLDPNARKSIPKTPRTDGSDSFKKPKPKRIKDPSQKSVSGPAYRDRAAERRTGQQTDYQDDEELLHAIEEEEDRMVAIEQSKFLGGDMEHTHLVKGLDFALLAKSKREAEEQQRLLEPEQPLPSFANLAVKQIITTSSGRVQAVDALSNIKTDIGKLIYSTVFQRNRPASVETFLPGRMSFVFDLDPDMNLDIPTATLKPKDEAPDDQDRIWCHLHPDTIAKLTRSLEEARGVSSTKRHKRKERPQETPSPEPVPVASPLIAPISIFDDVDDDYIPSVSSIPTPSSEIPPLKKPKTE